MLFISTFKKGSGNFKDKITLNEYPKTKNLLKNIFQFTKNKLSYQFYAQINIIKKKKKNIILESFRTIRIGNVLIVTLKTLAQLTKSLIKQRLLLE